MEIGSAKIGAVPPPLLAERDTSRAPERTELPPPKTVRAVDDTTAASPRERAPAPSSTAYKRSYALDYETGSLVFKLATEPSGDVVFQFPSENALRVKAYTTDPDGGEERKPTVERTS